MTKGSAGAQSRLGFRHNRFKLLASAALALLGAPLAAAQAPDAGPKDETADKVIVTGSRLRGVAPVGSPVQTMTTEAIEEANVTSTEKIIQQLPAVFDLGVSEGSRGQNGGSGNIVFGNAINLRGIGPYATLTVIDGHRAISNGRSVDPAIMPSLGLERIEVLTDGASAVYGSDAVAGVVNLVPRRFHDGGQVFGRYGVGDHYDEHTLGAAWGKTWNGGQVHLAYENAFRSSVKTIDRDFARADQRTRGGRDYRSNQCNPGNIVVGGVSYAIPAGGVTPATAGNLVAGTTNLCEQLLNLDLTPEQTWNDVSFTFNQDVFDRLEFVADGLYSNREFYRAMAGRLNSQNLAVPATNAFFTRPVGTTAAETLPYLFSEGPTNDGFGSAENWQVTGGLKYKITDEWTLEGLVSYGENRDISKSIHGINGPALTAALASSDPALAFDPYGLNRTTPAVLAGILNQTSINPTNGEITSSEVRLDGPLFSLPGGEIRVAAGLEHIDHDYHPGAANGPPGTAVVFRNFNRTVDSAYLEFFFPLVSEANNVPGLRSLEFTVAGRYDDYSDVGDTTNPKVGMNWVPVDGLKLRASYGTSLRAPTFAEIYGNSNAFFVQNYTNPAGGPAIPGVALSGGNLNLKPEEAETWSAGFDLTPPLVPGLIFSASYFSIDYSGQVVANLSDLSLLAREAELAGTGIILRGQAAADRVAFFQSQGILLNSGVLPNPVTLFVDGRSYNLGQSITKGIDFRAAYEWTTDAGDELSVDFSGTLIGKYKVAATPTAPLLDKTNLIFNPLKTKLRTTFGWRHDWIDARAVFNYVGAYDNDRVAPVQRVEDYTSVDAALNFSPESNVLGGLFDGSITLGLDLRNVFDQDPPYVNIGPAVNGGGGFDPATVNPVGRVFAVSLRKRW